MITCTLRRIDPARRMARFLRDGRAAGLVRLHASREAMGPDRHLRAQGRGVARDRSGCAALQRQAERKRRRGYQ
jgi:hypothetical protein